jgi:hypothetical protein
MAAGSATASLDVELPTGDNSTVATIDESIDPIRLAAGNGTDDCADGYDEETSQFPDDVTASDAAYFEQTDSATTTETLTGQTAVAPFIGSGDVTLSYTPESDTELALPAEWDNLAVAQGQIEARVTYTYTPSTDLPDTGSNINRIIIIATIAVLIGVNAVLAARRWRPRHTPPTSNRG